VRAAQPRDGTGAERHDGAPDLGFVGPIGLNDPGQWRPSVCVDRGPGPAGRRITFAEGYNIRPEPLIEFKRASLLLLLIGTDADMCVATVVACQKRI